MTLSFLKEIFLDHFHAFRLCLFWAFIGSYRRFNRVGRSPRLFFERLINWLFLAVAILVTVSALMVVPLHLAARYDYTLYCYLVLILYGASGLSLILFTAYQSPEEIGEEFLN